MAADTNPTNPDEWYRVQCGGHYFTLLARYQNPVAVGQGTFGAVM